MSINRKYREGLQGGLCMYAFKGFILHAVSLYVPWTGEGVMRISTDSSTDYSVQLQLLEFKPMR